MVSAQETEQRPAAVVPADEGDRPRILRERWFACTSALGWSAPAEWPHPTVDAVCEAVTARGRPAERDRAVQSALAQWGGARAAAGIGLGETLSDLAALHAALASDPVGEGTGRGQDGVRLIRVVSLAWTDVACGDLAETAVVDPLSGLASARYLRTRLAEVYQAARARGTRVGDGYGMVVVTMDVHGWSRVAPLAVAGDAAAVVFDAGESIAVVGRSTVVVLAPREGLVERAAVLRRLVNRRTTAIGPVPTHGGAPASRRGVDVGVRIVALPATHEGAWALLERLRVDETPTARRPAPWHLGEVGSGDPPA
jgi:hypothetical protein